MFVSINTGSDAFIDGAEKITSSDLGVRYSGFRSIDRFLEQIKDLNVGLISWPGGTLAEDRVDSYGMEFKGLTSATSRMPSLAEMMQVANEQGAGLSIVLPTERYSGRIDEMRVDVQNFMQDLLSGDYGPLPQTLIFHIGSEHYHHFQGLSPDGAAAEYGRVAAAMVEELTHALNDPTVNVIGADIDLSVQAGRTMAEDEQIRDSFSPEALANVDLVMHHRYAARAEGIDFNLKPFSPILDAWQQDVTRAGGDVPQIHLSEWNVASVTRTEGLNSYIRDMAAQGITVNRADVDLDGRTTTAFENYWQDLLATRDYGVAVPKLYLELFSEYQAEGLGAATIHAADLMHAGRMTYTDTDGNPVQFVGAEMIKMIYESVEGTQVLDVSTENARSSDLWTYAYEGDDRLVVFLASDDDTVLGNVTVDIEGLSGGYTAIWTDSLTAEVPADWMERFGVADNPNVDESNEGQTYAIGVRGDVPTAVNGDQLTVSFSQPGQVVRIVIAHTQAEAELIEEWAGAPDFEFSDPDPMGLKSVTAVPSSPNFLLPLTGVPGGTSAANTLEQAIAHCFSTPTATSQPLSMTKTTQGSQFGQPVTQAETGTVLNAPAQPDPISAPTNPVVSNAVGENTPEAAPETGETHAADTQDSAESGTPSETPDSGQGGSAIPMASVEASDNYLLPEIFGPETDEREEAQADAEQASSGVAEIATMAGSAFGAALMGVLASMAHLVG